MPFYKAPNLLARQRTVPSKIPDLSDTVSAIALSLALCQFTPLHPLLSTTYILCIFLLDLHAFCKTRTDKDAYVIIEKEACTEPAHTHHAAKDAHIYYYDEEDYASVERDAHAETDERAAYTDTNLEELLKLLLLWSAWGLLAMHLFNFYFF